MGRVYVDDDGRGIWMMRRIDILGSQLNSRIYIPADCLSLVARQRQESRRTYGLDVFSHVVRRNSTVGAALNLRTCQDVKTYYTTSQGGLPDLLIRLVSIDDVVGREQDCAYVL